MMLLTSLMRQIFLIHRIPVNHSRNTDPRAQTLPSPDTTALGNDQRLLYGFAITEEAVFFFEDNANGIVHDSGNNANRNRQHMMRRKYLTMAAACRKVNVWWDSSWYEDRNPEVTPCKDDILYFAVVSKHSAHLESAPLKEVLLKIGEQLDLGEPEWILV
ncbi:hypothetical protein BT96DRAFT_650310 [Gymnopus androsaceus JB14]|uniref:Uncharacterized protein n=1 Tax=Gymnopus androsaceus JB14 TaxID=1447944 RepID=A0A6A4HQV3_9AGAR|nr:hypothetical protein BT96DRAFT_650310 [Gymnopus androsaceus JB14]